MTKAIAPIVEGQGDVGAVPVVIRRILAALNCHDVRVLPPLRKTRDRLLKPGEFEATVQQAAIQAQYSGADNVCVLVVVDSEGECPATLGANLLERARCARSDVVTAVVLAHHEFEAWFLASAASLRGQRGLARIVEDHPSPEAVRGAKEWLRKQMPPGQRYSETVDQPALAAIFDMARARERSRSFRKFWDEIEQISRGAEST